MSGINRSGKTVSDVQPDEQTLQVPVAAQVAATEVLEDAADEASDELDFRMNRGRDSRGNVYARQRDYDWTRSTDVGPDRRYGETLAAQERRLGEEAEMARHRETARATAEAGLERERSCREQTRVEREQSTRDFWERAHLAAGREHVTIPTSNRTQTVDPRATLSQDELAQVNEQAARLAAKFEALSRADAARRLAEVRDEQGATLTDAVITVLDEWADDPTVPVDVAGVDPDDEWATVEGEITWLFDEPAARSQHQVGYLEDDEGTRAKVTIWRRSMFGPLVRTLSEGERVRIALGKPGEYDGQPTIAVTSKTAIIGLPSAE